MPLLFPLPLAKWARLTHHCSHSSPIPPAYEYIASLQCMGIRISSNAKWSLTDGPEEQSWEFAATEKTLSKQDMLCTPGLTMNICFVFLMPTQSTYGLESRTRGQDGLEHIAPWPLCLWNNLISNLFTAVWDLTTCGLCKNKGFTKRGRLRADFLLLGKVWGIARITFSFLLLPIPSLLNNYWRSAFQTKLQYALGDHMPLCVFCHHV